MKEAAGELNMTVIVCISVGILMAFFFGVLWPILNGNFEREANCKNATCNCSEEIREANKGRCECWTTKNGSESEHFNCPFGG